MYRISTMLVFKWWNSGFENNVSNFFFKARKCWELDLWACRLAELVPPAPTAEARWAEANHRPSLVLRMKT